MKWTVNSVRSDFDDFQIIHNVHVDFGNGYHFCFNIEDVEGMTTDDPTLV